MKLLFSIICITAFFLSTAQTKKLTVALDGSGDFRTVQAAIDAVPDSNVSIIIYIKNGIYKERITISSAKKNIVFVGQNVEKVLLTFDNYASKKDSAGKEYGTTNSASLFLNGDDISFENICFENSAGPVGQAVAVNIRGTRVSFKNCRFLGFQDTLYTKGDLSLLYFKDCYVEGTVDFIFGASTALFEDCIIFSKTAGFATAASTPEDKAFGYVFLRCQLIGDAPDNSVYLGRPWRPFAKTVFIDCTLGKHIKKEGWNNWGKTTNEQTVLYAEFNNKGDGANPTERAAWSHQLTAEEAAKYTPSNILGNWKPYKK